MRRGKSIDIDILNSGYRYALSLSADRQDSEDLVHDAWIRLDKRYGKSPEKSLLYTTIRNLYIDRYRRTKKIQFSEFEEDVYVADQPLGQRLTESEMNGFLRQLRDIEREALYLSVVEGYTAEEISRLTSTARGTILSLIHRSKIKLRTWMAGAGIVDTNGSEIEKENVIELITGGRPK